MPASTSLPLDADCAASCASRSEARYPDVAMDWWGSPGGEYAPEAPGRGGPPRLGPGRHRRRAIRPARSRRRGPAPMTRGVLPDRHLTSAVLAAQNEMMVSRWLDSGSFASRYRGTSGESRGHQRRAPGAEPVEGPPARRADRVPCRQGTVRQAPVLAAVDAAAEAGLPVAVHLETGTGSACRRPVGPARSTSSTSASPP